MPEPRPRREAPAAGGVPPGAGAPCTRPPCLAPACGAQLLRAHSRRRAVREILRAAVVTRPHELRPTAVAVRTPVPVLRPGRGRREGRRARPRARGSFLGARRRLCLRRTSAPLAGATHGARVEGDALARWRGARRRADGPQKNASAVPPRRRPRRHFNGADTQSLAQPAPPAHGATATFALSLPAATAARSAAALRLRWVGCRPLGLAPGGPARAVGRLELGGSLARALRSSPGSKRLQRA